MKKIFFSSLLVLLTMIGIAPTVQAQSTPQLTLRTVPFFEGFEEENVQNVVVAGWAQQSERGSESWVANSTYTTNNRTPYAGKWNAYLYRDNTDWLYTLVSLKADTPYDISLYARQDGSRTSSANITVALGKAMDKDSMTLTIIPQTGITKGDYQWLRSTFSVPADGDYVLGIKGYIASTSTSSYYLSLDNILLQERTAHAITIPEQECGTLTATPSSASMGDTVALSYTMKTDYFFKDYTTDVPVQWVDANHFIMPTGDVTIGLDAVTPKNIPYFEGFEEGNADQKKVADWVQQSEEGSNSWVANSTLTGDYRTPYAGSWNAYLYDADTDWLFQAFTLEAGKEYAFSMWARSYKDAYIRVMLGNDANKDAMPVEVVPNTKLSTIDYQYLSGKITVETTGTYVIGIRGCSSYSYNTISIDNIMVCEAQSHTIKLNGTHATLTADKETASVGDTVTLSYALNENYAWGNYTTDIDVQWIDANRFIMPDEAITIDNTAIAAKPIPYFEGFEEGNTDQKNVAGWLQQSERGEYSWVANTSQTSFNSTPYAGKWNATLYKNNTNWLFQYITLEQGKTYRFSMHARQSYNAPSYANITVQLGTFAHKDSMQTTIVSRTSVINGDYQLITGTFSVETTGNYIIGIKGYISDYGYYLSIDDIGISEDIMHTISTTNAELGTITVSKNSAVFGDTVIVSHTMTEGIFMGYATNTPVHWISDTSFVVLHDVVVGFDTSYYHTLPFFEGFENGNTDQEKVVGWLQQSESGGYSWVANATATDYNRTPYAGSWNATLYGDNTDWLYTIVSLKADTPYDISLFARQYSSCTSCANITVALGKAIDKDSMTINLIPKTGITNGDYQCIGSTFSVPADGCYVLGIKGYANYSPRYISIDNILLQEHTAYTITIPEQECGTLTATSSSAFIGDTIMLNYTMNTGYFFKDYTTDVPVQWVDANRFIMPAKDVTIALDAVAPKTIPYFEGFEEGNADQKKVAGWVQQSENGSNSWVANTSNTYYNRTPYAGSWNAYLNDYNADWLFQALTLEAGKEYAFSMWARSYADAYIRVKLGSDAKKDSMSVEVVPATKLSTSDYQYLSGKITVKTTGTYFIGIRGNSSLNYSSISIDNIQVRETKPHTITGTGTHATLTADKTEASFGDTVTLSYILDENYAWGNYTTDIDVKWIDANRFIMPDEAITIGNTAIAPKPIPYFEGFEKGNSDQQNVAGWLQQSEAGDNSWVANASQQYHNRAPHEGRWNAYLDGKNTDWLFQALTLEAGKKYAFSMWARSYDYAQIRVMLGNEANKDAMPVTVVPDTKLSTSDYQYLSGKITVETTGMYVIGIRGYAQYSSVSYTSIDNIQVCEAQSHTITLKGTHATLTADKETASVGDTVTLSYALDKNCVWVNYTTDIDVQWIDANRFIMPDEAVTVGNTALAAKPVPYFEGFEEGNTDQQDVAGWVQQSEKGNQAWVANSTQTDRNRTPYAGRWNATLYFSNTDWLFQLLALEAGENYALSLYARQDYENTSYANITAALGDDFNKGAMTTTILPAKGLTYGDYQLLTDTFQVAETKAYVLGIKGYISGAPYYISLDNIHVSQEVYPRKDSLFFDVLTEEAVRTALDTLTLTAVDTKGNTKHTFDNLAGNWVLDLVSHKATYTVADSLLPMGYFFADSTATIIVNLIDKHTVTATVGENGTVAGAGTYYYGTKVTLTATPEVGYHFVQWSDGTKDATYTFTLTGDTTLTAEFAIDQHTITIGEAVNGSVTGAGTYDYNTEVTLTATPAEHYHFVKWSNGATDATYTFPLTSDTTLTAEFAIDQHTVTLGEAVNGSVNVTVDGKDTTATTFDYGTKVTLTATPEVGYHFVQWSNGATDATYTFPLTSDTTLTAEFAIDQHTVTITAENGSIEGAGTYAHGTEVTLTATADTGYSFEKWSDGNTENPRTITVTEDVVLKAIFKQDAPTQLYETNAENKVEKVLRNGQVFIIRNGNTYDLTGRKAE